MRSAKGAWIACVLALIFGAQSVHAQAVPRTAAPSAVQTLELEDALHAMSRMAGVIFTGQVAAVRRRDGVNGATGVVEIEFAVEDAVRGVSRGKYTLREWEGLWPAGDQPFRVGQGFLMLLHAPGAAGLSSPVGGMDGAIPIRGGGPSPGPAADGFLATAGASAQTDDREMDLRWVGTRAVRPLSYRLEPLVHGTSRPVSALVDRAGASAAPTQEFESASNSQSDEAGAWLAATDVSEAPAAPAAPAGPRSESAAYATVLTLLRSWERDDHASR